ncbi:DUF393 domain-containing protein [Methyloparacoccus murrellii]
MGEICNPVIVFYDGGCPLCRREIDHYRRVARELPFTWVDVTQPEADLARHGLELEAALRRFHVIDRAGTLQSGARAFLALWSELPGYRWLTRLVRALGLAPLLDGVYARFAGWHFRRRCAAGACGLPGASP